jgi:hypothetical protein
MLTLDKLSPQAMINELYSFSEDWGLQVNIKKTAILILNISDRQLIDSPRFTYGDAKIPAVLEFYYLGTTFTISGITKINQDQLTSNSAIPKKQSVSLGCEVAHINLT